MATMLISGSALFCFSKSFPCVPSLSRGHKPSSKITFASYSNEKAKQNVQRVWETAKDPTEKKINETVVGFQQNLVGNALLSRNQMKENSFWRSYNENIAMVELDSMQSANSTVEEFCASYFMFHGLDESNPHLIFKYLPTLSFTESYIYQVDKMNEKLLQPPNNVGKSIFGGKDERETQGLVSCFPNDPLGPLMTVLEHKGLLTERIREELELGEEFWALERKLCYALTNKEEILVEDVMRANLIRSTDFRVLNLLLYQMRGAKVDESNMEFLSTSEFLVEIWDDLYDYEDDVLENTFNILRFFVKIYGASTAPDMLMKCISEVEDKYESLLKSLDPQLSLSYQKKAADFAKEGGKFLRHPLGTWSIPTVIEDEELYRSKLKSDT